VTTLHLTTFNWLRYTYRFHCHRCSVLL